ncbi:MAG: helix-turn-helix domain-containing protein [Rhodobacteraceae bacterium]|nr:helix-turn-helix domain-containing protein [Paracoccaceae bacterium]
MPRSAAPLSPDRLLSTKEVCQHFGLGMRFLEVARTRGNGPAFCRFGRTVKYRVRDVTQWLDAQCVTNTSEDS